MMVGLLAVAVATVAIFVWAVSRPRIRVVFGEGHARLDRGDLPGGLLGELSDIARHSPQANGELRIHGRRDTLKLSIVGLDEGPAQRVRNVVLLRRDRL